MLKIPTFTVPTVAQARLIQNALRSQIILEDRFDRIETVAGIDVGYDTRRNLAHASIVTMRMDRLEVIEQTESFVPSDFPYVPGFLSFREIPAILTALSKLQNTTPDLLMVDGQGIAHPRRTGIAAHLGVIMDMPSVGVAKSRLAGEYEEPEVRKGSVSPLMIGEEQVGVVLRSKDRVKPLFISPGHRLSIDTALKFTQHCITRYRLPEPTRYADKFSKC